MAALALGRLQDDGQEPAPQESDTLPASEPNALLPVPGHYTHTCLSSDCILCQYSAQQVRLLRIFMRRFMEPIKQWMLVAGWRNDFRLDAAGSWEDHWYLLKIHSPRSDVDIWIKFWLNPHDSPITERSWEAYFERRCLAIAETLEHHLITLLDNEDAVQTMMDGEPHFYHISGESADPDKVTKADLIY